MRRYAFKAHPQENNAAMIEDKQGQYVEHRSVVRMVKAYCKQCGKSRDHHLARYEFTAASFFRERIVAANYILQKLSARGK